MKAGFDVDPALLSQNARIDALLASERELGRVQAYQLRLIAAIAEDPCTGAVAPGLDRQYVKEELRAALGESALSVNARMALADELVHRLPATLAALEAGTIGLRHARQLADAVRPLTDADATVVEAAVHQFAAGRNRDFGGFCRKLRREVLKIDPRTVEEQLAHAVTDRAVWTRPAEHGMSTFGALLPAEGAQLLVTALDVAADRCAADDPRSKDQQRADALVQLAIDGLNGYSSCPDCAARDDTAESTRGTCERGTSPRWQGMRPSIQVTVALSTLLGLDEQPADLDGYGPIPAHLAQRLAADDSATWQRLVTDELGHLIDYGRTLYRPPADLRDHVIARDRTCRFPTCHRTACRCEIDHLRPWTDGGPTNEPNLIALCCRHHHGKHDTTWQPIRHQDGTIDWTSPTGHTYTVPAATYPLDRTHNTYAHADNEEHRPTQHDPDPANDDSRSSDDPPF